MAQTTRRLSALSLSALALAGAVACGGSNQNTPPQTTTTTAATTTATPYVGPPAGAPAPEAPMVTEAPAPSGADSPNNLATPQAGSTLNGTTRSGTPDQVAMNQATNRTDSSGGANDAQIAEVIDAANNAEIAQAREVLSKTKNASVKQYAQRLISDHTQAETKLRSITKKSGITPQDSAVSMKFKQDSDQLMQTLRSSSPADVDKTYIDAQVDEHSKVLEQIDRDLPEAKNADLIALLKSARTKVASHMKMAQGIQASLNSP
jgi:putative membrane protein